LTCLIIEYFGELKPEESNNRSQIPCNISRFACRDWGKQHSKEKRKRRGSSL